MPADVKCPFIPTLPIQVQCGVRAGFRATKLKELAYLQRYANQNKFYNTRFYIDDGHSGANFERPGFIEMKNDIENSLVGMVVTKDLSRLGRDYLTTGYY